MVTLMTGIAGNERGGFLFALEKGRKTRQKTGLIFLCQRESLIKCSSLIAVYAEK